ncbi:alpha-amylase [Exophiala viscosa]|uniref:alpha-amylase n=1 Tax=Exophiala viscosa TaxID=2486360 RepID=UPI002191F4CA|nr:alpha-amylase [Exophiala viscosa]
MGFDAIWISPVIHNLEENTTWGYSYHGYWGDDPFRLNDHFGTADDLRSLSNAIHDRDMLLMVDVVVNHLALNQESEATDNSHLPEPFNQSTAFHPKCPINYEDQSSIQDCWLVDSQPPLLADVNTENPDVFDALVECVVELVQDYSIDGIRLDTARHVPQRYLTQFQEAVKVFVTGEVLDGGVEYVSQYQGSLSSVLNYPLYFTTTDVFTGKATFNNLVTTINNERALFDDSTLLTNFLDNHDQPRFASLTGNNITLDINAATFVMLTTGIPIIYYGFEQRLEGAADPDNRKPLWSAGYDTNTPLYQLLSRLNTIRTLARSYDASMPFNNFSKALAVSDTQLAWQHGPLIAVVTNADSQAPIFTRADDSAMSGIRLGPPDYPAGVHLFDMIGCTLTVTTGAGGSFAVPKNSGPHVFAPKELAAKLCPDI